MVSIVAALASPQNWPASALVLVATTILLLLVRNAYRCPLPGGASWTDKGWPLLGSLKFFSARGEFLREGKERSANGHFNFYYGAHSIVALSGAAARSAFYTTRGLDLNGGFSALFASGPDVGYLLGEDMNTYLMTLFKRFTSREHLRGVLTYFNHDLNDAYQKIDTSVPLDPFNVMYRLVYQMTHRTLGSHDIANDPKLLVKTMHIYEVLDKSSAVRVMFPSVPTPGKLYQMWCGARLVSIFRGIMNDRRKTGRREDDAMQQLMDNGDSDIGISVFIIGGLFAGLINTGVHAAWMLCYLANDPYWYAQVQAQVDGVIAKHRESADETPADILQRLTLEVWETEFPLIDLGLRDSIRINLTGASLRKNISGKDLVIGDTGVVVPDNAFAIYSIEDVHMDENVYKNPLKWDPGRYLPDRAEDKKSKHGYVGWGTGLHPCLGMRMAKLEIAVSTATFMAYFDFKLVDKYGNPTTKNELPTHNSNAIATNRPVGAVHLKCTPRF